MVVTVRRQFLQSHENRHFKALRFVIQFLGVKFDNCFFKLTLPFWVFQLFVAQCCPFLTEPGRSNDQNRFSEVDTVLRDRVVGRIREAAALARSLFAQGAVAPRRVWRKIVY